MVGSSTDGRLTNSIGFAATRPRAIARCASTISGTDSATTAVGTSASSTPCAAGPPRRSRARNLGRSATTASSFDSYPSTTGRRRHRRTSRAAPGGTSVSHSTNA